MSTDGYGPFGPIAISLSGGGARAVGYHLGVLSYLDRLGLLRDVSVLSTVSGGTLIGTSWALSVKEGKAFSAYYRETYRFFQEVRLMDWALERLTAERPPSPSGRRTLAAAIAEAWDRHYFRGTRFAVFWEPTPLPGFHLTDVIFNATEFKSGLAFRFHKSEYGSRVGYGHLRLPDGYAQQVRMADIMAASSAIPVGVEPLAFPQDFAWPGEGDGFRLRAEIAAWLQANARTDSIALMDGGVYDNQGIESVLEAERERRQPPDGVAVTVASGARGAEVHAPTPARAAESLNRLTEEHAKAEARPGLFIISDTPAQTTRPMYEMPPPPAAGTLTLARVDTYSKLLLVGCVGAVLAMITNLVQDAIEGGLTSVWRDPFDGVAFVIPLLVTLLVIAAVLGGRRTVKKLLADVSGVVQTPWQFLRRLTVNDFFAMLLLRLGSLWALTNDIFMNRIRSMGYAYIFAQPSLESRILANEIFDLVGATSTPERPVSDAMRKIATDASTMGTALWLKEPPPDEPGELDLLIACGQMTTCYNLLERLARQAPSDETLRGLYARAREDWNAFLEDPYAFVRWRELRADAR